MCGVIAAIFAFSSQSYQAQNIQPFLKHALSKETAERIIPNLNIRYDGKSYQRDVNPFGLIEFLFRKGAHLFVYGSLASAAALVLRTFRARESVAVSLSLLAVLIVASLDEWNQRYSSERTPTVQDIFVDLIGGLIGLAICYAISRLFRRARRAYSLRSRRDR
nr:VanZ family protein [Cohnella zeiphila]